MNRVGSTEIGVQHFGTHPKAAIGPAGKGARNLVRLASHMTREHADTAGLGSTDMNLRKDM